MGEDGGARPGVVVPTVTAVGLTVAGVVAGWRLIDPGRWPDHDYGPYDVPPLLQTGATGAAVVVCVAAVWAAVRAGRRPTGEGVSWRSAVLLAAAGAVASSSWRVVTASSTGANIGGGACLLFGPLVLAFLLVGAFTVEADRRRRAFHPWVPVALGAVVVVGLWVGLFALTRYEAGSGVVTGLAGITS
jgi:hypothetical protein